MMLELNVENSHVVIKALDNYYRRRILALCQEKKLQSNLHHILNLQPPTVSNHIKLLETAGLIAVTVDRKNKMRKYVKTIYDNVKVNLLPVTNS